MRHEKINYLAVGSFAMLMTLGLLWALYEITGSGGGAEQYHVKFNNVTGIRFGTAVYYEGYAIGQVESIEPLQTEAATRYDVALSVKQGWRIKQGSLARITASSILAGMVIDIKEGEGPGVLSPGDSIKGQTGANMMHVISEVAADMRGLTRDTVGPLLKQLGSRADSIGETLDVGAKRIVTDMEKLISKLSTHADAFDQVLSAENRKQLEHSILGLSTMTDNFGHASKDLREMSKALNGLMNNENQHKIQQSLDAIVTTAQRVEALSRELSRTQGNLDEALKQVGGVIAENRGDARQIVIDLRTTLGTVNNNLDTILQQVSATSRNLNDFSRIIKRNPSLLIRSDNPGAR